MLRNRQTNRNDPIAPISSSRRKRFSLGYLAIIVYFTCAACSKEEVPVLRQRSQDDQMVTRTAGAPTANRELFWTLNAEVPQGYWLRVRGDGINSIRQYVVKSLSYQHGSTQRDISIEKQYSREDQMKHWSYWVKNPFQVMLRPPQSLAKGSKIRTHGELVRQVIAGNYILFRIESAETSDGPWQAVSAWNVIQTTSAKPKTMEAFLRFDGSLFIVYLDRFGNPAPVENRHITLTGSGGQPLGEIELNQTATGIAPASMIGEEQDRVRIRDNKQLEALSAARPTTVSGDGRFYFGDLHVHTEFSGDAHRPIGETIESTRDLMGLDFLALSDHAKFHGSYTWKEYFDTLDSYNAKGRFVTILGWEFSSRCGHFNSYFLNRKAANKSPKAQKAFYDDPKQTPVRLSLEDFYASFDPDEILVVPHHTNTTSGDVVNDKGLPLWSHFDWRAIDTRYSPIVEMVQIRGAFETENPTRAWKVKFGGYGASIRTALAKDLRVGFIGSTDNHNGWARRLSVKKGYAALACVRANELSRKPIFQAMRNRHTYATSGARMIVDFVLNEVYPMGSEVELDPRTERKFTIKVRGTAPIDKIQIISQGAVLAELQTNDSRDIDLTWIDPRKDKPANNCYYYLRVRQTDGHCAWISPIWIDAKIEN